MTQFGIEILRQRREVQNPDLGGTSKLLRYNPETCAALSLATLRAPVLNMRPMVTKRTCRNNLVSFKLQKVNAFLQAQ